MCARGDNEESSLVGGLGGTGFPLGGVLGEIIAGQTGMGLAGVSEGKVAGLPALGVVFGKNLIRGVVIWQTLQSDGARIWVMRSSPKNLFLPASLEIRTSSTGHAAGGREVVSPSVCLWDGTNRMCPEGIWMSVSKLGWLRIAAEHQGVSSHTGSTMTTKSGVVVSVEKANACRMAFIMSPGSYSGFAMHEPVSR